jgi:hypothetical protein
LKPFNQQKKQPNVEFADVTPKTLSRPRMSAITL